MSTTTESMEKPTTTTPKFEQPINLKLENEKSITEPAYAKLKGTEFEYYIRKLTITLGRNSKNHPEQAIDCHISDSKTVSHQHAQIKYNYNTGKIYLLAQKK